MRTRLLVLTALAAIGYTTAHTVMADEMALLTEASGIHGKLAPKLLEVLTAEIAQNGYASAIPVCQEKAPQMAKTLSDQTGWAIRRISLKNRNPGAAPDAWERTVLEDFDRRIAVGENPAQIEQTEVVMMNGQKVYRYVKALPTQDICMNCHGTPDKIAPDVQAKIKQLYPDDKANGYGLKQVRGAITAWKPL